jgi:Fe-S oxidoreductase
MGPDVDPICQHAQQCRACGLCVRDCAFLQHYGNPKDLAVAWLLQASPRLPFACSLCGLCGAVCPVHLKPQTLFFAMRQQMVQAGKAPFPEHRRLLRYEGLGNSKAFTWLGIPPGCDTILFPGCAFAGTRSARLMELYQWLRQSLPGLGLVLACCGKPSHDLGLAFGFIALLKKLRQQGIQRVLVLCPSCYTIFAKYAQPMQVSFAFAHLGVLPRRKVFSGTQVTVHDPCTLRQEQEVHSQVRRLLRDVGLEVVEMAHRGEKALCCGEGGAAACVAPKLAKTWGKRRSTEAKAVPVVGYCAGCVAFLAPQMQSLHLVDLLFAPEATLAGKVHPTRPPWTYLKRLLLRYKLKRLLAQENASPCPR